MSNTSFIKEEHALGLGGVAIGTAFEKITDEQAYDILEAAWELGLRHYDTSPWYGLTKSERRFGEFLKTKQRDEYILSTKVGRLFSPVSKKEVPPTMWKDPLNFDFKHDYTADATRKSLEDSLERTGLSRFDIIYIHDLSEDQVGDRYDYYLEQAKEGAFKVLSQMRQEGIIKAWGMGNNKIEPILDCIQYGDPDICLSATQYSILQHEDTIDRLLPAVKKAGVKLVSGAGYNSGYVNGRERFNYKDVIPKGMKEKRERMQALAKEYNTTLTHAALQFVLAADEFIAIVPGASKVQQVKDNYEAWKAEIPADFWKALKAEGLISQKAQTPA